MSRIIMSHDLKATMIAVLLLVHEWYPSYCCSDHDCLRVSCATLVQTYGYWEYLPKHVWFASAQVSPDNHCHVCIDENNEGICLFVPQGQV